MLTLAKRPAPILGNAPRIGKPMTEDDYASEMRKRAILEGHRVSKTIASDADFLAAIRAGNDDTVSIASYVSCSRDHARKRLLRLEACGMITADRTETTVWRLK